MSDLALISGPSGCGKTTLVKELLRDASFRRAITATTRAARAGEVPGVSYHFKTQDEFALLRSSGELIEWAMVHGQWYGTPRSELLSPPGRMTVLDVDVQGFRTLKASGLTMISVFISPPSLAVLEDRLRRRGTESEEQIQRRLARAGTEMSAAGEYDHILVNDELRSSVETLRSLLKSHSGGLPPDSESRRPRTPQSHPSSSPKEHRP